MFQLFLQGRLYATLGTQANPQIRRSEISAGPHGMEANFHRPYQTVPLLEVNTFVCPKQRLCGLDMTQFSG